MPGVSKQKRGIVGGQAQPDAEETRLPKVFQVGDTLDFVVAEAHAHHSRVVFFVQEVK